MHTPHQYYYSRLQQYTLAAPLIQTVVQENITTVDCCYKKFNTNTSKLLPEDCIIREVQLSHIAASHMTHTSSYVKSTAVVPENRETDIYAL